MNTRPPMVYGLEDLYTRLGRPAWYWPAVGCALLVLLALAGNEGVS